ncbi:hypothetical protein GCM10010417_49930 [Streptomyces carpaticus]
MSTAAAWCDLPDRYGPWKTVYERFRHWPTDGTWDRLLAHVQQHCDPVGAVDWLVVCVDSTTVRAHQRATGARKGGFGKAKRSADPRADQQDPPRLGRPGPSACLHPTGGNVNNCTQFEALMGRDRADPDPT